MPCHICNTSTGCQCSSHTDIYEKTSKFVQDTIYDIHVPNHELSDHLLKYISSLKMVELYLLAKHIPEYRRPTDMFGEEAKTSYIYLIYNTYKHEIRKKRKEIYILYHTEHIVNAGSEEDIYRCIVREILQENADIEELLDMLLYGIEFELFDKAVLEKTNEAVMRIQANCVLAPNSGGDMVLRFNERLKCTVRVAPIDEPYKCEICYEDYTNSKTRVYLGDCTHSFCFECVQKHATTRPSYNCTIECPFCRAKTNKLEFTSPKFLNKFNPQFISIMNFR